MDNENKERVDQVKTYQIDRAQQYVAEHKSKDGSDDTLEVCIISDLLRQLKLSTEMKKIFEKWWNNDNKCFSIRNYKVS